MNFQMFKLDLDKVQEPEIKLSDSVGSYKKQEDSLKSSTLLYWLHQRISAGEGIGYPLQYSWASLVAQLVRNPSAIWVADMGSIPGLGRSPGERKGYPLQYSGLENSMDYTNGVSKSQSELSNFHFTFKTFYCVNHNKLWKILQEMGIPHHLTCLLRNLHASQEATVRTDVEQWTGQNWERSTSRLYSVTLLI